MPVTQLRGHVMPRISRVEGARAVQIGMQAQGTTRLADHVIPNGVVEMSGHGTFDKSPL